MVIKHWLANLTNRIIGRRRAGLAARRRARRLGQSAPVSAAAEVLEERAMLVDIIVTSLGDEQDVDGSPGGGAVPNPPPYTNNNAADWTIADALDGSGAGPQTGVTLREAIQIANANQNGGGSSTGVDRIIFHSSLDGGTIFLQSELPTITDDVQILGMADDDDGATGIDNLVPISITISGDAGGTTGSGAVSGTGDGLENNNVRIISIDLAFSGDPNGTTPEGEDANATDEVLFQNIVFENGNAQAGDGGAIQHLNTGELYLVDVEFNTNQANRHGGAIAINAARLFATDTTFQSNTADAEGNGVGDGGAIYQTSGITKLTESTPGTTETFVNGGIAANGGGIYSNGGSVIIEAGVDLLNNTASNNGGGLWIGSNGTGQRHTNGFGYIENLRLNGSNLLTPSRILIGNTAQSGGAVYMDVATRGFFDNVIFRNAEAEGDLDTQGGGALFLNQVGDVDIYSSSFETNRASGTMGRGGAIYGVTTGAHSTATGADNSALGADVTVVNTDFTFNEADKGGALYITGSGEVELDSADTTFTQYEGSGSPLTISAGGRNLYQFNRARSDGGVIYVDGNGYLDIVDPEMRDNVAGGTVLDQDAGVAGRGGAIFATGNVLVDISGGFALADGLFTGNRVDGPTTGMHGGGAIYNDSGDINGSQVTGSGFIAGIDVGGGVTITANTAIRGTANGGGVYNTVNARWDDFATDITNNTAAEDGGGVFNQGDFNASSTFFGNNNSKRGAGFFNNGGTFDATGITISGNNADTDGGGLFNDFGGRVDISVNSDIDNNDAYGALDGQGGAGIYNRGILFVQDTSIDDNGRDSYSTNFGDVNVDIAGDRIVIAGHRLQEGREITFRGINGGVVPQGINPFQTYFVRNPVTDRADPSNDSFQISATLGGPIVDITGLGSGIRNYFGDLQPDNGGGILNAEGGLATISESDTSQNSSISNNEAVLGGGFHNRDFTSTMTIADTEMRFNDSDERGGAGHVRNGSVTVDDGLIQDNDAGTDGGGLSNVGGTLIVSNVPLIRNEAARNGGGLFNDDPFNTFSTVTQVENSIFVLNEADGTGGGGAIYNNATLFLDGSSLNANRANNGDGGGLVNTADGFAIIDRGLIAGNFAAVDGGGISNQDGTLEFDALQVNGNTAVRNGGGLNLLGDGNLTFRNGQVNDNVAGTNGGGIFNQGTLDLSNFSITRNTASGDAADEGGGGIFNDGGTVNAGSGFIRDNVADGLQGSGGGILDLMGHLTLDGTTVTGNTANRAGGGIELNNTLGETTITDATIIGNTATGDGDALGNGGGLHVTGASNVTISGGSVTQNVAEEEGGGLWNGAGILTINNGTQITQNQTRNSRQVDQGGGGIFNNGGTLNISGTPEMIIPGVGGAPDTIVPAVIVNIDDNVARAFDDLIINEVFSFPNGQDANGDGIFNEAQDEFIEIVNLTGAAVDISGWTISDDMMVRHTFGPGTILNHGQAVVVFGGGTPTGGFGGSIVQTASTLSLDLDQDGDGDTITLADASSNARAVHAYGAEQNVPRSFTRNPDGTGDFVDHFDATNPDVNSSPGTAADGTNFTDVVAGGASGGGILSIGGTVDITLATVSGNEAVRAGGGIEINQSTTGASLTLTDVNVDDNDLTAAGGVVGAVGPGNGAGIHLTDPADVNIVTLDITRGSINGNDADNEGGGLWVTGSSEVTLTDVTVDGNTAGAEGGGLFQTAGGTGFLNVITSTVSNNTAVEGGGIFSQTNLSVQTSTISGNTSTYDETLPGIVINEFFATAIGVDTNGDGFAVESQDEYVEIVNLTGAAVDISGWTLNDTVNGATRHNFAPGTILQHGQAIVVFGGGVPTGTFGGAQVVAANSGSLGLDNGGDTITLRDAGTNLIDEVTYGAEAAVVQALTRSPEATGNFVVHNTAPNAVGTFSPGRQANGGSFATIGGGGGIHVATGTAMINGSTLANNTAVSDGGGLFKAAPAVVTSNSSLYADNVSGSSSPEIAGTIIGNNNLVEDPTGATITGINTITGQDPRLGTLQDNGGPTFTHELLLGSPALNAGLDTDPLGVDQRGAARPNGGGTDIGAFERSLDPVNLVGLNGNSLVLFSDLNPSAAIARPILGLLAGEMALSIDVRESNGLVYLLTSQNNIYTVNTTTGQATFVSALTEGLNDGLAELLDADRNLNVSNRGWFYNAIGRNEKWIFGTNSAATARQWYVILPNGNVHEYTGGLGTLVGSFGTNVYEDPTLLTNAFDGFAALPVLDQNNLVAQDLAFGFYTHNETTNPAFTEFFRNVRGLGEVWIKGVHGATNNPWYVILPNGDILKQNNDTTLGPIPVATVHPFANEDPTVLTKAYDNTVGPIAVADNPDATRNFYYLRNGNLKENSLGRREKHFLGTTTTGTGVVEYFIEPNGNVYNVAQPFTVLFNFGTNGYEALDRVVKAHDDFAELTAAQQELLTQLDFQLGLFRWTNGGGDSGYFFNANGGNEKWIRGKTNVHGNNWYHILPNGSLHAWAGGSAVGGTVIADASVFGVKLYENPQILYEAYDDFAMLGTGILDPNSEVDIDFDNDADGDTTTPLGNVLFQDNGLDTLGILVDNGASQFLRTNVNSGLTENIGGFGFLAGDVFAFAFNGNGPGVDTTQTYAVDYANDTFNLLNPTTGALTLVGNLNAGVDLIDGGLEVVDIDGDERHYMVGQFDNGTQIESRLYFIDQVTGKAFDIGLNNGLIGALGAFQDIHDITALT